MKKKYVEASIEIVLLDAEDVIATSAEVLPDSPFDGDCDEGAWT